MAPPTSCLLCCDYKFVCEDRWGNLLPCHNELDCKGRKECPQCSKTPDSGTEPDVLYYDRLDIGGVYIDRHTGVACTVSREEARGLLQDEVHEKAKDQVAREARRILKLKADSESTRNQIAAYFDHLSKIDIGMIDLTGMPAREFYTLVKNWIKNKLDQRWVEDSRP